MTKSVAILGCGPAGLLAAHAANMNGWDFQIYSQRRKSPIFGAQYLHDQIPGVDVPTASVMLRYELVGTPEDYRQKVYGPTWDGTVSPEDLLSEHRAWDLRATYNFLWYLYEDEIRDVMVNHVSIPHLRRQWDKYDLVISTIPRRVWDDNPDNFQQSYIWALGDADHVRVRLYRPNNNTVVCDGTRDNPWYRVSNIFNYCTMEWPQWHNAPFASVTPPARGAARVAKPLAYTGSAATDIIHLGRYAEWTKGVLTTDVFSRAMGVFAGDRVG